MQKLRIEGEICNSKIHIVAFHFPCLLGGSEHNCLPLNLDVVLNVNFYFRISLGIDAKSKIWFFVSFFF